MKKSMKLWMLVTAVAMAVSGTHTHAVELLEAFTEFTLEVDDQAGTFEVFAEVSTEGGIKGLATFSVPLAGDIISAPVIAAPRGEVDVPGVFGSQDIGFVDNQFAVMQNTDGSWRVFAEQPFPPLMGQDAPPGTFYVFHFGQQTSRLSVEVGNRGTLRSSARQEQYDGKLLLVTGNWDTTGTAPHFNQDDMVTNAAANVYLPISTPLSPREVTLAFKSLTPNDNGETLVVSGEFVVPEPTSMFVLAVGGLLGIFRTSRQHL